MIEMTIQRDENGKIAIHVNAKGTTNELIDELAAGMATAIVMVADELQVKDSVHEQLARIVCSLVQENVSRSLAAREAATDKLPEA